MYGRGLEISLLKQCRLQLSFPDCTASDKWRFSVDVHGGPVWIDYTSTLLEWILSLSNTSASTAILFLDVLSPTTQHASTVESIWMVTKRSAEKSRI